MVLQREQPVRIWGKADIGEKVTVAFGGQSVTTKADPQGNWSVDLQPMPASSVPRELIITGTNTLNFRDILVGEVWVCSGQSNMEKNIGPRAKQQPTDHYEKDFAEAGIPDLRLFQMPRKGKLKANQVGLRWVASDEQALKATEFSAAAWHFGRELQARLKVPVGLVHSSFGGTRIEQWIPRSAFLADAQFKAFGEGQPGEKVDGVVPSALYESMIEPLTPYAIRGFLWYQGESNCMAGDGASYADKMRLLIETWRKSWKSPAAPFYYVLLAPYDYSKRKGDAHPLTPEALAVTWEAQIAALSTPGTAVIPSSDLSADDNDIHPTNKHDIGLRLAHVALAHTYQLPLGVPDAPRVKQARFEGAKVILEFTHAGAGLGTKDGQAPRCFEVAGPDRIFHPAQARLVDGRIELSNDKVPQPVAARHAFRENAHPNLGNSSGLPALPWRSDKWPVVLERAPETTPAPQAQTRPNS